MGGLFSLLLLGVIDVAHGQPLPPKVAAFKEASDKALDRCAGLRSQSIKSQNDEVAAAAAKSCSAEEETRVRTFLAKATNGSSASQQASLRAYTLAWTKLVRRYSFPDADARVELAKLTSTMQEVDEAWLKVELEYVR